MRRTVSAGLGVLYIAAALAIVLVAVLIYNKAFTSQVQVDLKTDSVGNALQKGSDVQVRGVPVGTVKSIEPTATGALIRLDLQPDKAREIPADTTARLLPKTLFGERYVSLEDPEGSTSGSSLANGDTIVQDRSQEAVELEQVFDSLLPLLTAVQPEKISATLSEIATALRGRGRDLGDTLTQFQSYIGKLNPQVPKLANDLGQLGQVADQYNDAVPDLLSALDNLTATSQTISADRAQLSATFATVATASDTTRGFLTPNEDTIVIVSREGRRALDAVAPYASTFPCTFRALREFVPVMDRVLGEGTKQPGLHATLSVVDDPGRYLPGKDAVHYTAGKAACPYYPGSGTSATSTSTPSLATPGADLAPATGSSTGAGGPSLARTQASAGDGLGKANSPAENQLIAELVAPEAGVSPSAFPRWGSLLLGPTLRGETVDLS